MSRSSRRRRRKLLRRRRGKTPPTVVRPIPDQDPDQLTANLFGGLRYWRDHPEFGIYSGEIIDRSGRGA